MPFCGFMHAMNTCLNAWLFNTVTHVNQEDRYSDERDSMSLIAKEMLIPQPIAEYLAVVNTMVTTPGDTIRVNLPEACLPQLSMQVGEHRCASGSFGVADVGSHNAYECYVSPLVTREAVRATILQANNWNPLPEGFFPAGALPNKNLLGYFPPQRQL